MRGASQFVTARLSQRAVSSVAFLAVAFAFSLPSIAQGRGGPPSTTMVDGHFLAPAPSVTSIGGRHLPPPLPSVTSIPNMGTGYHYGYGRGYYGNRGYRGSYAYSVPYYYYPLDDPGAYGYDYVGGGPDLYSGPTLGPDQNPHIIVEQPPARRYPDYPPEQAYAAPPPQPEAPPAPSVADLKPGEPTVLVFRDGHKQEVTNYAIMGDTLYVFDQGRKKIALADLDMPATVKANDDQGLEFKVPSTPAAAPAKKKNAPVPQSTSPDQGTTNPPNVASTAR